MLRLSGPIGIQSPQIQNTHIHTQNPMIALIVCDRLSQLADSTREYICKKGTTKIKHASSTTTAIRIANLLESPCSQSPTSHRTSSASTPVAPRTVENTSADIRRRTRLSDERLRFPPHKRGNNRCKTATKSAENVITNGNAENKSPSLGTGGRERVQASESRSHFADGDSGEGGNMGGIEDCIYRSFKLSHSRKLVARTTWKLKLRVTILVER